MRCHLNTRHFHRSAMKLGVVTACLLPCTPLLAQKLELRATLEGHTENIVSLAFSADGKTLASGSADNSIKLWKVATRGPAPLNAWSTQSYLRER
jgi:WD40 repeat protein